MAEHIMFAVRNPKLPFIFFGTSHCAVGWERRPLPVIKAIPGGGACLIHRSSELHPSGGSRFRAMMRMEKYVTPVASFVLRQIPKVQKHVTRTSSLAG